MGEPQFTSLSPNSGDTEWDLLAKLVLLFGGTPASEDTAQALLAQLVTLAGGGSSARLGLNPANLSGSEDYQGITFTVTNGGSALSIMQPAIIAGDGTAGLASNADANHPARGIVASAASAGQPVTLLVLGLLLNTAANFTPGGTLYLGESDITQTIPVGTGIVVQQVGFALTADIAFIDINSTYLVLQ